MTINKILLQGGAWAMIGDLGAINAICDERSKPNSSISKDVKIYCFSAGALAMLTHVCGLSGEDMLEAYDELSRIQWKVINEQWSLSPTLIHFYSFQWFFERCPHAYKRMNEHNCRVGVSTKDGFKFFKNFTSNRQLAEIMLASYHIPTFCTYNAKINGKSCVDGGALFDKGIFISDNPDECLIVSNIQGLTMNTSHVTIDIPKIFIALPIPGPFQQYYFDRGYKLTKRYLENPTNPKFEPETSKWGHLIDWVWLMRDNQAIEYDEDDLDAYVARTAL